jgi:hypothetical protein
VADPTPVAAQETVADTAAPTTALHGWAALQQIVNEQLPADLNKADALLTDALRILGP